MDTFSIVRNALAATEDDPDKVGLDPITVRAGRVLAAVQVVVDALTPPDGGRYIVRFADIGTAATSLADHAIIVSSKPLRDRTLSIIECAVVIATFAAHEIGHTIVTRPRRYPVDVVKEHNPFSGYHTVANIADDIILEPVMADRFPILTDAFEFTAGWVLRTTNPDLPIIDRLDRTTTTADRFNIILHATRYGDIPDIIWDRPNTIAERDWARDWAARLIALRLTDHGGFIAACDEVWERIREVDQTEPEDEPEPEGPDGDDEPEPDDDGPGGDEPGGDEPEGPDGDDESEPPVTCGGDEPTDEPRDPNDEPVDFDDDETEPGDEPGEDGDDEGEGEGDPEPGDDDSGEDGDEPGTEDGDDDGDERGPETEGDSDGEKTTDTGGGGNAEADKDTPKRDEDDFDTNEVDKTTHDQAESTPWDEVMDAKVRTYESTTGTIFGVHGRMTTTWE